MSKPRSDAILFNLPEEQQAKLADWLLGGMPYHQAKVLVEKEFGITFKSLTPFTAFWEQVCAPHLLARRRQLGKTAEVRAEEAKLSPGKFDAATLDALKQKAYELAESPNADPKDVKSVMMLLLKAQDQEYKNRKLALDVEKFEFDAVDAIMANPPKFKATLQSTSLSEKQKRDQLRLQLFGAAPE